MAKLRKPKVGDWRALAEYLGVPGVKPETGLDEIKLLIIEHNARQMAEQYGQPPSLTAGEYRDYMHRSAK